MKQHNSLLFTLCLVAFLALGTLDIQAQKLAIPRDSSNNLILHNVTGDTTIFKIDSSEIIRLTKSGRLGIGVAPSYALDLFSSDYVVSRFKRSGIGGAVFRLENGNSYSWEFGMGSNGEFGINKSGDALGSQFFIKNNGNVGIGTTSPDYPLEIEKSSNDAYLTLNNTKTSDAYVGLRWKTHNQTWGIYSDRSITNQGFGIYQYGGGTGIGSGYRLVVSGDGNVGIGTTSPGADLHIQRNKSSASINVYNSLETGYSTILAGQGNNGRYIYMGYFNESYSPGYATAFAPKSGNIFTGGEAGMRLIAEHYISLFSGGITSSYERMRILANGNVGIGTTTPGSYKLYVNGSFYAPNVQLTSDARFKKDIQTITASKVAKLDQVRGTSYKFRNEKFKERNFSKKAQMGIIAQELIKVYPELVNKGEDGYYSVNYTGLIPVLVEAVKDLRKKNGVLKANVKQLQGKVSQIEEVKAQNKSLEARLSALEKLLLKAKK